MNTKNNQKHRYNITRGFKKHIRGSVPYGRRFFAHGLTCDNLTELSIIRYIKKSRGTTVEIANELNNQEIYRRGKLWKPRAIKYIQNL